MSNSWTRRSLGKMWDSQCRVVPAQGWGRQHLGPQFRAQLGGDCSTFSTPHGLGLLLHPCQHCSAIPKNTGGKAAVGLGQDKGSESWEKRLKPTLETLGSGNNWTPLGPWLEREVHLGFPKLPTPTPKLTKDPPHCHGNQG